MSPKKCVKISRKGVGASSPSYAKKARPVGLFDDVVVTTLARPGPLTIDLLKETRSYRRKSGDLMSSLRVVVKLEGPKCYQAAVSTQLALGGGRSENKIFSMGRDGKQYISGMVLVGLPSNQAKHFKNGLGRLVYVEVYSADNGVKTTGGQVAVLVEATVRSVVDNHAVVNVPDDFILRPSFDALMPDGFGTLELTRVVDEDGTVVAVALQGRNTYYCMRVFEALMARFGGERPPLPALDDFVEGDAALTGFNTTGDSELPLWGFPGSACEPLKRVLGDCGMIDVEDVYKVGSADDDDGHGDDDGDADDDGHGDDDGDADGDGDGVGGADDCAPPSVVL